MHKLSRRELSLALVAASQAVAAEKELPTLESHAWRYQDLPVKHNGPNSSRAILDGKTHTGYHIDMHMTELAPGQAPHPPHQHVHEELLMLQTGTLEVTIDGKSTKIGPGSTVYVASNQHHGWKNAGDTNAQYFVMALGRV